MSDKKDLCGKCGGRYAMNKDGGFRRHAKYVTGLGFRDCPGSGKTPSETGVIPVGALRTAFPAPPTRGHTAVVERLALLVFEAERQHVDVSNIADAVIFLAKNDSALKDGAIYDFNQERLQADVAQRVQELRDQHDDVCKTILAAWPTLGSVVA